MPQVRRFPQSTVVFDDRYHPLLISTFFGKASLESARWHMQTHDQAVMKALRSGQRVVSISDATSAERPGPEVRSYWAEHMTRTSPEARKAVLATFVVVTSPIIRGVMTAIGWMNEEARAIETFATLAEAIREAQSRLAGTHLGSMRYLEPNSYKLPAEAANLAG